MLFRSLGRRLATGQVNLDEGITLAMVSAENGDFETAIALQRRALAAVTSVDPKDNPRAIGLRVELETQLARYERGEACRLPWRDDDPLLSPPPLSASSPTTRQ